MKNKIIKYTLGLLAVFIVVFLVSFALEDKTEYKYNSTYEEQPLVYVTKYGDCYHSINCHYLSQSRIEKGLYQAQKSGYRACSYCDGIPYDTTLVEHREYYEVTSYTNAILYSLIRSVIGTIIVALLGAYVIYSRNHETDSKPPEEQKTLQP